MIYWCVIKNEKGKFLQKRDRNKNLSLENKIEVGNINQAYKTPMTREEMQQWIINGFSPEVVEGKIIHS